MRIDFFEEYPQDQRFESWAKSVEHSCRVILAAKNFDGFLDAAARLQEVNPRLEATYWPILRHSYWISPFAYPEELDALYAELSAAAKKWQQLHGGVGEAATPLRVMLDLELPLLHKWLFIRNSINFFGNKRRIDKILGIEGIEFYTAEYPAVGSISQLLLRLLGVSPSSHQFPLHIKMPMYYTSMIGNRPALISAMRKQMLRLKAQGTLVEPALGTIATGVFGNEPKLSAKDLDRDVSFFAEHSFESVCIFRLGGVDAEYAAVLRQYQQ